MSEVVFLRHAATDLAGTFCGQLDPPVNALGRAQIAECIRTTNFAESDAVYSSDLQRARTTAEAVASVANLRVVVDAAWREASFGEWEGLTWTQVESKDAAFAKRWANEFPDLPAPQGELYSDFCRRVLQAVERLRFDTHGRVAVVTHAGVLRVVLEELCGATPELSWQVTREYCSGFRLSADNTFAVLP